MCLWTSIVAHVTRPLLLPSCCVIDGAISAPNRRGFTFGDIDVDWDTSAVPVNERGIYHAEADKKEAAQDSSERQPEGNEDSQSDDGDGAENEDPATVMNTVVSPARVTFCHLCHNATAVVCSQLCNDPVYFI